MCYPRKRRAGAEVAGTHKNLLPCLVEGRLGRVDALGRGQRQGITLVDPRHLLEHGVEVLDTPPPPCTLQIRTGHLSSPSRPLSRATHSRGILFFFWTVGQTGVCRRFLSCHQIPELFTGLCHCQKWPFSDKTGNRKPVVNPRSVSLCMTSGKRSLERSRANV